VLIALIVGGCGSSNSGGSSAEHAADGPATTATTAPVATHAPLPVPASATPEPGGYVQGGGVIARVGPYAITRSALEGRMRIELLTEAPSERVTPVPPKFSSCISRLAELSKPPTGKTGPDEAQLRNDCRALYKSLVSRVLSPLISAYWVKGGAHELGINVSAAQLRHELAVAKGAPFRTETSFRAFLAQSGESIPDLLFNIEENVLAGALREEVEKPFAHVSDAQVAAYYKENEQAFYVPEERALGLVRTSSEAAAARVERELRSGVSFAAISKRLAPEQPRFLVQGLLSGLKPGVFKERALNDAIFSAKTHVVEPPVELSLIKFDFRNKQDIQNVNGYYIFEVQSVKRGYQRSLAQVKAEIAKSLPVTLQKQADRKFIGAWREKWRARTDCSPGYVVRKCRQFKPVPGEPGEDPYTYD
jgi:PPIC-type PPIASE domain